MSQRENAWYLYPPPPLLPLPFFYSQTTKMDPWQYVQPRTPAASQSDSASTASTVEHCPTCRAERPDIVAARVRVAALTVFVRQARLEIDELAALLAAAVPPAEEY